MATITKIAQLFENSGKSANSILKELDFSPTALSEWKRGKAKPTADALSKIADYFDVSVDYLLGRKERQLPANAFPVGAQVQIPVLGSVRAGYGGRLEEDFEGYELLDTSQINGHSPSEYFWLRVSGDSMSPSINNNDLVLVHKQSSVDSGSVAVVGIDEQEAVVKKIVYKPNCNWVELHSFNAYYPPRRFEGDEELQRIIIIGQVKKSSRNW